MKWPLTIIMLMALAACCDKYEHTGLTHTRRQAEPPDCARDEAPTRRDDTRVWSCERVSP